jgi:uncharacterized membrane protein
MTAVSEYSMYHRWLGSHARALRRLAVAFVAGLIIAGVLSRFWRWEIAVLGGWDTSAAIFLITVWSVIARADGVKTRQLATREDETGGTARLLLMAASLASLFAVAFLLGAAGAAKDGERVAFIAIATLTVISSWTVVNTVYTLRYADLYFTDERPESGSVDFSDGPQSPPPPDYRDFAYLAFTIGMTYQVSDTALRDRRIRRHVLSHALMSYIFGVVIVSTGVNLVSGLVS